MPSPSLPGGTAAKVADRYEVAWTVNSLLDLIAGEIDELHLEQQSKDGLGVEFCRGLRSGLREYHSVKRQAPGSSGVWTAAELGCASSTSRRSIIGDLLYHLERTDEARAVFVSQDGTRHMREITERARTASTAEEFFQLLSQEHRQTIRSHMPGLYQDWADAYGKLDRCYFKTVGHPELVRFVEQRVPGLVQRVDGTAADPIAVRHLLGEFAWNRLAQTVTLDEVLRELGERGFSEQPLGANTQIRRIIEDRNQAYTRRIESALINGASIPRRQATDIFQELSTGDESLLLAGSAGDGKTCIVAQVVMNLQASQIPHLVLSMEEIDGIVSSTDLGSRMGLPASPAIVLGQISTRSTAVLCIDQLDALSIVAGRNVQQQTVLNELIQQVEHYPHLRMLLACRSFDIDHDPLLLDLVCGEPPTARRIDVERLSVDDVHAAIAQAGMEGARLTESQVELLRNPLHLYLFISGSTPAHGFVSRSGLFDHYWEEKRRRVDSSTGSGAFTAGVEQISKALNVRRQLRVSPLALTGHEGALEAMASEGVVVLDASGVSFFHASFFDYAFARGFINRNESLVDWLMATEQGLFRRSQVRQIIEFLREDAFDDYLSTLERLLGDESVRFHIKKLILDWLGALPDPKPDEWVIVERLERELGEHTWSVVRNSVPWFDVLNNMGRWGSWLDADELQIERALWLLSMPNVLNSRSAAAVALVERFRGHSDEWRSRLQWLVARGHGFSSPEMQVFVIDLIADGTLDDASPDVASNDDWWSIWYESSTKRPAFIVRVLGAWFDRQLSRVADLGRDDPLSRDSELAPYSQISGYVISECAARAPREFVRTLFPRLARFDYSVPRQRITAPSSIGRPDQQLHNTLAEAMASLAHDDPTELDSIVNAERLRESNWMHALLLRSWSANPSIYAERIVRLLLENSTERLNIGYSSWTRDSDAFAAVSRIAVAAASTSCCDESFVELENAILDFTPDWERHHRMVGRTRLALLRALAPDRIGEATRRQILELQRRFPEAAEHGAPEPVTEESPSKSVGSPIPEAALRRMADDHWLSAMAKYTGEQLIERNGDLVGGAQELAWELTKLVREEPARFAALADRMDATLPTTYFDAILGGLTRNEQGPGRPGTLDQVCSVLRRISELGIPVQGREIAHAIATLSDEAVPDDIVQMLCRVALEDPDPVADNRQDTDDSWDPIGQAINSARGAAARALAQLLFVDQGRWDSLKTTVEEVAVDNVLAVRSVAVECLLAILDVHRGDALACFDRLTSGADPLLGTDTVERFVRHAMFRDYPAMRPTLLRMLRSSEPAAAEAGARQVTLAGLWLEETREDAGLVLGMGEDARIGAARMYAFNLSDETVGAECERCLLTLFSDDCEAVRKEAGRCWLALEPDQIASRGALIGAFAESLAADGNMDILLRRLGEAQGALPAEVCDLAEGAVATYGFRASSIQYREGGAAYQLAPLMVRLYNQTSDSTFRKRILDSIDEMIRAGFRGIDEQLEQQYDR